MYLGVGIMSNALMPYLQFVALAYFVFQYSAIIHIEEEYLSGTFSNWKEYSESVPRFIPKVKPFHGDNNLVPNFPRAVRSERSSLIALSSMTIIMVAVYFIKGLA